jgi:hypothetical protein
MNKAAALALLSLALAGMLAVPTCGVGGGRPAAPEAADRSDVETRFAQRYCYHQYRDQTDVVACLARLVP